MNAAILLALVLVLPLTRAQASSNTSADPTAQASPQMIPIKPKSQAQQDALGLIPTPTGLIEPDTMIIDANTAATLDPGTFATQTRFYSGGGVLQYISLGVFNGLNVGASMTADGLIGNSSSVGVRTPQAQVKYRFFDGNHYVPALAVGYDGQGYDYNRITHKYNDPARGFYLVGTQELFIPGLVFSPSVNASGTNSSSIYGALPITYTIENRVSILAEWDNIHNFSNSRVNAGLRFYITNHFDLDVAVRRANQNGYYSDGTSRGPERIIQLRYVGNF
jgi:hypothetical protein